MIFIIKDVVKNISSRYDASFLHHWNLSTQGYVLNKGNVTIIHDLKTGGMI